MADSKISALTAVVTPAATDEYATNQGGVSKRTTLAQVMTFVNTASVWAAGTASAGSWPKFTPGTLLTTAEEGAIELDADCFYACTDAGNRGYIPVRHFCRADSTRTFTSNTSAQALFTSPAGGALTLETGTYLFEALLAFTGMSATSGNLSFNILGAGGATLAAILYQTVGSDRASGSAAAAVGGTWSVAAGSAASVATPATGTALCVHVKGTFEVSAAGTIIPSITLLTASAAVLSIGSHLTVERIGSQSAVSVGQWA